MTEIKKDKTTTLHRCHGDLGIHKDVEARKKDTLKLLKKVKNEDDVLLLKDRHKDVKKWGGKVMFTLKIMGGKSHAS